MSTRIGSELQAAFESLLKAVAPVDIVKNLPDTPGLAAAAFADLTRGYEQNPAELLERERFSANGYLGLVEIPNIDFMSLCEHTLLPFVGVVHIAYQPDRYLAGAGVFEELVFAQSRRLCLQEPLTQNIAETILQVLSPKWVQVELEAKHCCMNGRILRTEIVLPGSN